jgi:hypothetical protein
MPWFAMRHHANLSDAGDPGPRVEDSRALRTWRPIDDFTLRQREISAALDLSTSGGCRRQCRHLDRLAGQWPEVGIRCRRAETTVDG